MFTLKGKVAKIATGFVVTSFLASLAIIPASAADLQLEKDSNASIVVQEEVQEGSYLKDMPDKAAAQITVMEDGSREILVRPKSKFNFKANEITSPEDEAVEDEAVEDEAVEDEAVEDVAVEDEAVEDEAV
ncbi:MAG: hypothetical protein Q7J85_09060, partial [Bacillota bacterium]|nr:hypothetical protein [Bacillota bacterium]